MLHGEGRGGQIKFLFANKFFYPKGGAETVFFQEREMLRGAGHAVVDFSMHHPENIESPFSGFFAEYVEYRKAAPGGAVARGRAAVNFLHNRGAVRKITALVRQERPAIAHLHNIYHQLTPAIIPALKREGVKIVLTMHDYKLACPNYLMLTNGQICSRCAGRRFYHAARHRCEGGSLAKSLLLTCEAYWHRLRKSYAGVDLFIAPSRFMAETMARFRLPAEKIRVLLNGIDTEEFRPGGEDSGYFLYFGRISREKGVPTLIDAYRQSGVSLGMKIVGTGPLLEEMRRDNPDIDFPGFQQGAALRRLVGNASAVVVPSEWYENCSMTVLEAMALGKPVIGAGIGGIPEQVENGVTGLLFTPGSSSDLAQKIRLLADDRQIRQRMGEAGRRRLVEHYSLAAHRENLFALYQSLLAGRGGDL